MWLQPCNFSLQNVGNRDASDARVRRLFQVDASPTLGQRRETDFGAVEGLNRGTEGPVQRVVQRQRSLLKKKPPKLVWN